MIKTMIMILLWNVLTPSDRSYASTVFIVFFALITYKAPIQRVNADNEIQLVTTAAFGLTETSKSFTPVFNGPSSKHPPLSTVEAENELVKNDQISQIGRNKGRKKTVELLNRVREQTESRQTPHRLAFLDGVLEGYDKRAWPSYGTGSPTQVQVNIYVNSLGSVNAANMEYSMDIYLRQLWLDHRLDLTPYHINETLTLNGEDISSRIWKPDLFFRNVKQANFHLVTVPNILIKMSPNGRILYSMRLTLRLSCHMSFRNYPLDTQRCHVILGAYAQTTDQIVIKWQDVEPIVIERPVEVPEFDLVHFEYGNFTRSIDTGSFSFLNASFVLQRQNGYHVVQTYLPTFLIVMISWVSFWLNVDASPARVTLGVTTLLTLTTVASGVRTQLPPVSYVKAIDVWIGACSVMVFGALLEFALVNFLSRSKFRPYDVWRGMAFKSQRKKEKVSNPRNTTVSPISQTVKNNPAGAELTESINTNPGATTYPRNMKMARTVDRISRVTFPLIFFVFNIIYWPYYLYVPDGHESR